MKRRLYIFVLLIINTCLFAQPRINSFIPTKDSIGAIVTIEGSGFSPVPANNVVYFGAVKANVFSATQTQIKVKVPVGANYKPISVTNAGLSAITNLPFIVTFPNADTTFNQNSFGARKDFVNGSHPMGLATGDLDGDGKPDVVVANGFSNFLTVFLNRGVPDTVSFLRAMDIAMSTGSNGLSSVAVFDLDQDGRLDIIATTTYSNIVAVFRNLSSPGVLSFAPKIEFTSRLESPWSMDAGDLDGDGRIDLVVANFSSNNPQLPNSTISILRSNSAIGSILFDPHIDITAMKAPWGVCVTDLDGDGKPDIAVSNNESDSISIHKNLSTPGNISFAPKIGYKTGKQPYRIIAGDLDGDGRVDLATLCYPDTVCVFRNVSSPGSIVLNNRIDYRVARYAASISFGDIDGDGKPEIVAASDTISVLKNISTPGIIAFKNKVDYPYTGVGTAASGLLDCDNDGKLDMIMSHRNLIYPDPTKFSVFRFQGKPLINNAIKDIWLYPNPVQNILTIRSSNVFNTLKVIDATGRLIMFSNFTADNIYKLNISRLPSGFYILQIFDTNNQSKVGKFIVQQ